MLDHSYLDTKYFIDTHIYNCPFCNRRHVQYSVMGKYNFNWTTNKSCWIYIVKCHSCNNESMHLSFHEIIIKSYLHKGNEIYHRFTPDPDDKFSLEDLDNLFFYSVPTSFFVLDSRIPSIIRELMTEAEGCLKSNFLTGSSACARKIVYELAVLHKASGDNYEARIKSLKTIIPNVDPTYFDTLLTIQQVASTKVHEESYDGWEAKHLRLILSALSEIFTEIYVVPAIREEKRKAILDLKSEIIGGKAKQTAGNIVDSSAE